ncbi:unnamed protein product [Trichobilharzia regenti]|nr:unnamed protein product [Trichobilharzia regenti]
MLNPARTLVLLLQRHSIPQRLFGDVVLGMCQASVSDILSKTRPWSQLSNKARIPYVRLHLWLQEPDHLEILKSAQANIKCKSSDHIYMCVFLFNVLFM